MPEDLGFSPSSLAQILVCLKLGLTTVAQDKLAHRRRSGFWHLLRVDVPVAHGAFILAPSALQHPLHGVESIAKRLNLLLSLLVFETGRKIEHFFHGLLAPVDGGVTKV